MIGAAQAATLRIAFRRDGTILLGTEMAGQVKRCGHATWSLRLAADRVATFHPCARAAKEAAVEALIQQKGETV